MHPDWEHPSSSYDEVPATLHAISTTIPHCNHDTLHHFIPNIWRIPRQAFRTQMDCPPFSHDSTCRDSVRNQSQSLAAWWSTDDITNELLSFQQAVTGSQSQTQQFQSLPSGWTIDTEATWPSHASEPLTSRYNAGMRPISHQDIIIA